jgi:hypothetical protein
MKTEEFNELVKTIEMLDTKIRAKDEVCNAITKEIRKLKDRIKEYKLSIRDHYDDGGTYCLITRVYDNSSLHVFTSRYAVDVYKEEADLRSGDHGFGYLVMNRGEDHFSTHYGKQDEWFITDYDQFVNKIDSLLGKYFRNKEEVHLNLLDREEFLRVIGSRFK